jgi:hypothetical protein
MTRRRDDSGVSLLVVLVLVTSLALVMSALLTYTGTALKNGKVTLDAIQASSDISGALDAAVNDVRQSDYNNNLTTSPPQSCPLGSNGRTYGPASGGVASVTVTCSPDPGSGAPGGLVQITNSNRPDNALLTLAPLGTEDGISKGKNSVLAVKGNIYTNSNANATGATACAASWPPPAPGSNCNGIFVTAGSFTSEGTCTGTIVTSPTGTKSCGAAHSAAGNDPGITYAATHEYDPPTTGMTPAVLPDCSTNPVTFSPGYYDDVVGLNALTNGAGPCRNKTFWFRPGNYYFDFHNVEMPSTGFALVPHAAADLWTFDDAGSFLIAGTKNGWTTMATQTPGSCVSPLNNAANSGVAFVFGGDSRFEVDRGNVEICGTYAATKPPIALHGLATTIGGALTTEPSISPSGVTSVGANAFTGLTPIAALAAGETPPVGPSVTSMPPKKTATLTITGFGAISAAIPARAVLESAVLTVAESVAGADADTTFQVTLTRNGPNATTVTKDLAVTAGPTATYAVNNLNITADLAAEIYSNGLANNANPFTGSVVLSSGKTATVSAKVDYVKLVLKWRPLSVRAESGCIILVVGVCPVIGTNTQQKTFYVQGTAYLPKAKVDLTLNNVSGQVFRAGLIARAAALDISASSTYSGPLIELPTNTLAPSPVIVFFTAWSCPPAHAGVPSSTGPDPCTPTGRAKVRFSDANPSPVPGDRQVTILGWQVTG